MAGGSKATPKNKTGSRWYKSSLRHAWGVGPPVRPAAARQPQKQVNRQQGVQEQFASRVRGTAACMAGGSRAAPKTSQQTAGGTTAVCVTRGGSGRLYGRRQQGNPPKNNPGSRWYKSSLRHAWGGRAACSAGGGRATPQKTVQVADGTRAVCVTRGGVRPLVRANLQKCAPKRLPARIWSKTAVSQGPQKGSLIVGRGAAECQKFASKRLLDRIWPKTAVSQGPQKESLIAGRGAAKCQKFASKRLLARIWLKTAVSQGSQKGS